MKSYATALVISTALLTVGGCYNPDLGENPFLCSALNECPSGYICHTIKNSAGVDVDVCLQNIPPDTGIPDRPFMTDTELLPQKEGFVYLDSALVKPAPLNCADYSDEPNNNAGTATGLFQTGLITGWEICYRGDVDQYKIKLEAGKKLTIKVDFTHSKGDLDAALVAPDGYITASRSETDDETLTVSNTTSADESYYLGVWGHDFDTNIYNLDIQIQ